MIIITMKKEAEKMTLEREYYGKITDIVYTATVILMSSILILATAHNAAASIAPSGLSYTVYQSGGTVYVRNEATGNIDFSGTDATTMINSAINKLTPGRTSKEKVVLQGDFSLTNSINIPSYTILEIQGTLTNTGSKIMIRSNPFQVDPAIQPLGSGAKQVEITGGIFDMNGVNQHIMQLTGNDGLIISGVTLKNTFSTGSSHMAITINHGQNIQVSNISINFSSSVFSSGGDGVHLVDSSLAIIDGVYGQSVDDFVALTNYKLNMSNIMIKNIIGRSQHSNTFVITDADLVVPGKSISNVSVTNILSDMTAVPSEYYCLEFYTSKGGVIRNINLNNVHCTKPNIYGAVISAPLGIIDGMTISNFIIADTVINQGVRINKAQNINLINGVVYNSITGKTGLLVESGSNNIILRNIVFRNNTLTISGGAKADHNMFSTSSNCYGTNCIIGNPQFINPANGDFHLQSTSPAIDTGSSNSAPSTDLDGDSRPQGAGYDIGAYEYVLSPIPPPSPTPTPVPTSTPTPTPTPGHTPNPSGLAGYWKLDESNGTSATDSSGNGNKGTLKNFQFDSTDGWTAGKVNNGLKFDSMNDYVDAGNGPRLNITGNNVTVEAWIYQNAGDIPTGARRGIVNKGGTSVGYGLILYDENGVEGYRFTVNGQVAKWPTTLRANQWVHLAGVYNGTQMILYLNGVQKATQNYKSNILTTTSTLKIGERSSSTEFFNGLIDEVKIYNRALSASEILADYNAGK